MAEQLQPLFNQLSTRLKAGDHSAAVQVCDQILAAAPGDADALHAKMVSLIELSRVEDALLLADSSPPLTDIVRFERAYCLYQLHREQESLALLMPAGVAPSEVREMQLAAQIFYRLGEYGQAADLFRQAEATGGPSAELSTNILAALVLAGRSADGVEYAKTTAGADEPGDKPHELVYNYACAAIEQGQMRTAKQLLQKAIELCRRTMAEGEDWSEEEVEVRAALLKWPFLSHLLAALLGGRPLARLASRHKKQARRHLSRACLKNTAPQRPAPCHPSASASRQRSPMRHARLRACLSPRGGSAQPACLDAPARTPTHAHARTRMPIRACAFLASPTANGPPSPNPTLP
jgi:tetratricopeptide (TPR) repeat protein